MRIKELSTATGVPVDTIRHYEKAGLLRSPPRGDNNYRRYAEGDVQRLTFIRNCRSLDMSLDEVRVLLAQVDHPRADCSRVDHVIDDHLRHVRERLVLLSELERQLEHLQQACGGGRPHDACGIVHALSAGACDAAPATRGRGVHSA